MGLHAVHLPGSWRFRNTRSDWLPQRDRHAARAQLARHLRQVLFLFVRSRCWIASRSRRTDDSHWVGAQRTRLSASLLPIANVSLLLRPIRTTRTYGPYARVSKNALVHTARTDGPYIRVHF